MNPIVYNKNGQFRFNDFVGYLPEFLKTEPDVVTLMQVMSDYINNAYRNIETTEEFEFVRVCTSSDQGAVRTSMERLSDMLRLAAERGDAVRYLSVPRNNVKSNVIIGNEGAEYAREAEIDLPEIQDVITSASGRHLVDDRLKDGSVVYIRYRNADPIRTIAYYYSAADDTLVKEPAGNSQDPFTGSDNNPQTSIEFKVSDVGHVLRRYGGSSNDRAINYYEIFFTVKITDVKRVNALDSVFVDVDGVDNKDDQVLVDYYNQSATAQGNYNAFIKFAEGNSFNWVGEFPSGIFYLRDTSSSKLTTVSSSNYIPMTDTALSPEIDRYRVSRIDVDSTGMLKIYTATGTPGIYSDALMYLMHGNEQVALLKMNSDITSKSRKDDGELYTTVFPVSLKYDIYDIIGMISDKKSLTLVSIPLAQSYYTLDINNKRPLIRWEEEYTFPDGMSVDLSDNVTMNEAYVYQNYIAARVRSSEWQQLGLRSFYTTYPIPVGLTVMCPELWGGVATVTESRYDNAKGKYYTETDSRFLPSFDPATLDEIVITHPSVGVVLSQFASNDETGEHAYVVQSDDGWNVGDVILAQCVVNGDTENSEYRMFTVTAVELDGNGKYIIHVFHPSYDSTTGLGIEIVDYTQLSRVVESNNTRISSIDNVHRQGENIVATARRYTGPIFTASYMAARLKDGDRSQFSLLKMVADVKWYYPVTLTTGGYDDGTYVYNPDDQNVYRVKKSIVTKGDETVEQYDLVLDNIKHYSVGYKKIYNAFMPYAGAVSTLDYGEQIDYAADDMSTVRVPLYIKKTNDMRLRYGWKEREYLYYGNDIGIGDMERAGFVEFYAGNPYNVVDVDMADRAVTVIDESETGVVLKKGVSPVYVIDIDKNLTAIKNSDGRWVVTLTSAGHGLASGMKITVSDVTVSTPELSEIFNVTDATIRVVSPDVIEYESDSTVEGLAYTGEVDKDGVKALAVYNRPVNGNTGEPLKEGDVVEVLSSANDEFYVVSASNWKKVDRNAVLTPFTLYSQQNLFDVSLTNPAFAMSEGYKVHRIRFIDKNTAQVNLAGRIPSSDLRKGTRVFIRFANHSAYNGWHMVTSVVNGGGIFNIKIDGDDGMEDGLSLVGREMTLYVGMWHKYTVYAYDWNKVSNFATYATTNSILEVNGSIVRTKYKHGFSVGDRVIVDQSGDGAYNYDGGSLDNFIEAVVVDVPSDETVVLDLNIERDPDNGPNVVKYGTIYRGCIVRNNVGRLNGEYTWRGHRFIDGEIVIATDQICEDENIAWRVSKDSAWIPMRKKRTFKIVRIDVDMMPNPKFDETNPVEEESELKYRVFGDNVVYTEAESGSAYLQAFGMTRNYHFDQPYLENLDTTQDVQLQYSSKYDYGTVAPRDDMDSSFKGVPDMDYSLAERIERLAYLKDASVIDYDLIGYLARFMGYDITAVADDVSESGVYNTNAERENALRETISHLPQYYALNGTKAGINMLMATFGLVGELITMWTNTADPYGELVRQTDIDARVQKESTLGRAGQWVPTPHVVLDVLDEPTFPSVSVTSEDIERVREQIRCCKPINVVFDGIRVVMKAYDNAGISVVAHDMGARYGVNPIFLDSGERVATYDENVCLEEDCSF